MNEKDKKELEAFLLPRTRSEGTRKQYLYAINVIGKSMEELRGMADDSLLELLNSKITERDPETREMTRSYHRRFAFRYLLRFLGKSKLEDMLVRVGMQPRRRKRKDLPFPIVKQLVRKAQSEQHKLLFMLLSDSGARIGAVVGVKAEDIGWDGERAFIAIVEKKTGSSSTKYLSRPTSRLLKEYLSSHKSKDGRLFPFRTTERARQIIKSYRAGISPHWFRHSKAVTLFRQGYDIVTVSDMLDHRSLESTRHYLKSSGISSKKIMQEHEPEW